MTRAEARRIRVSVELTAILDEAGFDRSSDVQWSDEAQAYVVDVPSGGATERLVLGATPTTARRRARRRRWESRASWRQRAHEQALDVLDRVKTIPGDIVSRLVRPAP